jgi:hypothetical protein
MNAITSQPPLADQYFSKGTQALIYSNLWEAEHYYGMTFEEDE